MEFREWPLKYKITSMVMTGILLYMFVHGIALLLRGSWRDGFGAAGFCLVMSAWAINPEVFFLPIRESAEKHRQFLERHRLIKQLTSIGLAFLILNAALTIIRWFFLALA